MLYHSGMATDEERDILRRRLRRWGQQYRIRDQLVQEALRAGILIEEIHHSTGLARTTIDRIKEKDFPRVELQRGDR